MLGGHVLKFPTGSKTYHKAFGVKTLEDGAKEEPLGEDAMLLIASCTKLMTSIAALQCVEKGLIGLDDDVAEKLPELAEQQILTSMKDGKAELTPRKNKITLRYAVCLPVSTHEQSCLSSQPTRDQTLVQSRA